MKKLLFVLAGAFIMISIAISCSNDDSILPETNKNDSRAIGFKSFLDKNIARGTSVAPGNLKQDFWVHAYYDSIGDRSTSLLKPNFMYNQHVYYNNSDSSFAYTPTKYWPNSGDVDFYAWTPNSSHMSFTTPVDGTTIGYPVFTYTVTDAITSQEDILVAATEDQDGTSGTVNFGFDHAMTKVAFCARTAGNYTPTGVTVKLISIKLDSIANSGTFHYERYAQNRADSTWWSLNSAPKKSYIPSIGSSDGVTIGYYGINTYLELIYGSQFMFMMPQSFANTDASITIVYKVFYTDGTAPQTFTKQIPLSGTPSWIPGNYVNYAITISLNIVTMSGVVSDWNVVNPLINLVPTDDEE